MDVGAITVGGRSGGARQGNWEMSDSNRDKIVKKIVAALQQHAPAGQLMQLENIARRYEMKIFCTAPTSDEYFLQITKKLTSLKEKSAQRESIAGQPLGSVVSGQTSIMGTSTIQRSGMAQHLSMSQQGGGESMNGIQVGIPGGGLQGGMSTPIGTQGLIQGSCAQGLLSSHGYAGSAGMQSPQSLSANVGGGSVGNSNGGNIMDTSSMGPQPYAGSQSSGSGGSMYGASSAQMGQYRVQVGMQSATLQGNGGMQQVVPVPQSLTQTCAVGADGGGSDPDFMAMAMVFAEGPSSMGASGSGSGSVEVSGGNAISNSHFNGVQMGGGGSTGSPSMGSQGNVASIAGNRAYPQSQQQQLMHQQQQQLHMQQQQQQLLQQQQQRRLKNQMLVQQRQQQMQMLQQQLLQQQGGSGGLTQNLTPQQKQQLLLLQQQSQHQSGMSVQGSVVGSSGLQGQQTQLSAQGARGSSSEEGGGNTMQQLKAMLETMRKSYLGELKTLHKVLSFNLKNHNSAQASQSSQIKRDTLSTKLSELYQMIQILEEGAIPSSTMDLRRLVQLEKKIKMYISWFQQKISCLKNKKKDFAQAQPSLSGDVDGVLHQQQMQPSPIGQQQDGGFADQKQQLQQRQLQHQQAMMLQQNRMQQSGGTQQAGQTSQVQGLSVHNTLMQNSLGSMQGGMDQTQGGMSSTNTLGGSIINRSTGNKLGVIDTRGGLGQQHQQGTVQHGSMSMQSPQSSNKSHASSANQLLAAIRAQPPTRLSMARLTSASTALQQASNGESAELLSVGKVINNELNGTGNSTNADECKPQLHGNVLNKTQGQTTSEVKAGGGETANIIGQGEMKPSPSIASQELLEECRKACEEIPGLRLQADDAAAQAASAAMSVGGAPHGIGIQCWLQDSLSVFAPLLLLVPDGYPARPPTVCFNSATASNAKLLEEARSRFLVAIKKMVPPHQLINVARAWKEAAESALSAHKECKDIV